MGRRLIGITKRPKKIQLKGLKKYKFFLLLFCSVTPDCLFAQHDSTSFFLQSKGTWSLPMTAPDSVYTFTEYSKGWGCYWESIGFTSKESDTIYAVFAGEVIKVFQFHDIHAVIVRFGDYYITYSNLRCVSVAKGEMLIQGAFIGQADATDNGQFSMDIHLTKKGTLNFIDPEFWFSRELDKIPRIVYKHRF